MENNTRETGDADKETKRLKSLEIEQVGET